MHLLLISDRSDDLQFSQAIAQLNGYQLTSVSTINEARQALIKQPGSLVFWNAENEVLYGETASVVPKYAKLRRIFVVTEKPMGAYPHLLQFPILCHQFLRRYDALGVQAISKLCQMSLMNSHVHLKDFFPEDTPEKVISIQRAFDKRAAVEALENVLIRQEIRGRLASLIAQSVDELMMNAIFDAPIGPGGKRVLHGLPRDSDFELIEKMRVKIQFCIGKDYLGVSVTDLFGSLTAQKVFKALKEHSMQMIKQDVMQTTSGFGLHGIWEAGLSLFFFLVTGKESEVGILVPKTADFRSFRRSFRFLSLIEI